MIMKSSYTYEEIYYQLTPHDRIIASEDKIISRKFDRTNMISYLKWPGFQSWEQKIAANTFYIYQHKLLVYSIPHDRTLTAIYSFCGPFASHSM